MVAFHGYKGREKSFWTKHHKRWGSSILAVGRGNATPSINKTEYAQARKQFETFVRQDFPESRASLSVLDCGFGHGHYAVAAQDLGFGSYVGIDFASGIHPQLGPNFQFLQRDLTVPFDLNRRFDLVLCIDVIFHIVDDSKFKVAIANIAKHARDKIYISSLFTSRSIEPYVKHRPVSDFWDLGATIFYLSPWRDNKIARFQKLV